jgi:Icc-related predicted phosphoesterase
MIIAVSDLHGFLPEIPDCDVLLIAGDICPTFDHSLDFQLGWLDTNFRQWLEDAPTENIIGVAGNHDFVFEARSDRVERLELPWLYLEDSSYKYQGIKYYGLPWIPNLKAWAFYANDITLARKYEAIPDDVDIILSHGPPLGYCDRNESYESVGSVAALSALQRVSPKAFVCGHIHEAFGEKDFRLNRFVYNVSYVDEWYKPQDRFTVIAP